MTFTTTQIDQLCRTLKVDTVKRRPGQLLFNSPAALAPSAQLAAMQAKSRVLRREQKRAAEQEVLQAAWDTWRAIYEEHRDDVRYMLETRKPPTGYRRGGTLVAQLSDLHFGSLIYSDTGVSYNMGIAAKRLRMYAQRILDMQLVTGADRLEVCLTGDLVDSKMGKERLDKIVHSTGPQTLAMAQGADLIQAMVCELAESEAFGSIRINGTIGNEARSSAEQGYGEGLMAENLDSVLHAVLSKAFEGTDVECNFSLSDLVIEVEDQRILLTHGHTISPRMEQRELQRILGDHGADFGISGHIHYAYATSDWVRSASLCGGDGYSRNALRLRSRAGQNLLHLQGLNRSVMVVDLEDPGEIEGYPLATYDGAFGVNELVAT